MNIGIDARILSRLRTGIENYGEGMIRELPRVSPDDSYYLYSNRPMDFDFSAEQYRKVVDAGWSRVPGSLWLRFRGGTLAKRDRLDVFWSTHPVIPASTPTKTFQLVTIHDLVWLKYPDTTSHFNLLIQKMWTEKSIREADLVIANSRSTQQDLMETLGVPAEKIRMIYPGISDKYRVEDKNVSARYISEKYRVPERYIAALGSVEPRKNFGILVEAMRLLKSEKILQCPLVIAGGSGWKNSALHEQIRSAGLTEEEIRFLGYVPDDDLQRFYGGARLFLFPSLNEGFGFPPLEAMACGTAVIASNARCMPEVLGDAAVLLPPMDAVAFAEKIASLLNDDAEREALQTKGVAQAQRFDWKQSARNLSNVFHEARK